MDILQNSQANAQKFTFNISLAGTNVFQTGNQIVPYTMNANGLVSREGYLRSDPGAIATGQQRQNYIRSEALDKMLSGMYRNVFEQTYAKATVDAEIALEQYQASLSRDHCPHWDVSQASPLEKQLKLIANVIAAYKNSPTKRQTFFITVGRFDMHKDLMTQHPGQFKRSKCRHQ